VVLVDDVTTTGSTLLACTQALQAAGVKQVQAVVLARTPA
jgi:predicted amidophosphoribosyltransferase